MTTQQQEIYDLVKHWTPEFSLKTEGFEIQVMRAFLNASACARCQKEVIEGRTPMRPLNSFPNPSYVPKSNNDVVCKIHTGFKDGNCEDCLREHRHVLQEVMIGRS